MMGALDIQPAESPAAVESRTTQPAIESLADAARSESLHRLLVVLVVLASATALRVANDLDTATISTVYGAALGYATGLTARKAGSS